MALIPLMRVIVILLMVLSVWGSPQHRLLEARLIGRVAQQKHLSQMRPHVFKPCPSMTQ